jgi:hypothetical protein
MPAPFTSLDAAFALYLHVPRLRPGPSEWLGFSAHLCASSNCCWQSGLSRQ